MTEHRPKIKGEQILGRLYTYRARCTCGAQTPPIVMPWATAMWHARLHVGLMRRREAAVDDEVAAFRAQLNGE